MNRCACTRLFTIARLDRAKARERAAMLRAALRVRWKEGGCHACVNGCDSSHLASEARRGKVKLFLVSAGSEIEIVKPVSEQQCCDRHCERGRKEK